MKIKLAAPRDKEYMLADGDGLYLRFGVSAARIDIYVFFIFGMKLQGKLFNHQKPEGEEVILFVQVE